MIEPNSELIIDFELVRKNIQEIKQRLPNDCNFMGVIKSDAYPELTSTTSPISPSF